MSDSIFDDDVLEAFGVRSSLLDQLEGRRVFPDASEVTVKAPAFWEKTKEGKILKKVPDVINSGVNNEE